MFMLDSFFTKSHGGGGHQDLHLLFSPYCTIQFFHTMVKQHFMQMNMNNFIRYLEKTVRAGVNCTTVDSRTRHAEAHETGFQRAQTWGSSARRSPVYIRHIPIQLIRLV